MENKNGFPVAARVTLGRGAVDVRKTFDHLRGLGFDEVGFAPASAAEGSPSALTEEELCAVMEGFRDLADGYVDDVRERRVPAFSNMSQILALIHRGDPMPYPCGAGIGMLAVDPSGAFYPCHRLVGIGDSFGGTEAGISDSCPGPVPRRGEAAPRIRMRRLLGEELLLGGVLPRCVPPAGGPLRPLLALLPLDQRSCSCWVFKPMSAYKTKRRRSWT